MACRVKILRNFVKKIILDISSWKLVSLDFVDTLYYDTNAVVQAVGDVSLSYKYRSIATFLHSARTLRVGLQNLKHIVCRI